jgi:hypothetical protein
LTEAAGASLDVGERTFSGHSKARGARLQGNARGCDGSVREELAEGLSPGKPKCAGGEARGGGGLGQGTLAVKPDETFWQRFLATYRFRRNFGRERWWSSFWGTIRAACPTSRVAL